MVYVYYTQCEYVYACVYIHIYIYILVIQMKPTFVVSKYPKPFYVDFETYETA